MPVPSPRCVLLAAACLLAAVRAQAQYRPALPAASVVIGAPFRFTAGARTMLQGIWHTSTGRQQEEVACLGGYQRDGVSYITSVVRVPVYADSMNASAAASLRQCGVPGWLGTVHTHIAHLGGIPYVTFSAPDRGVMREWHRRWKADGVFCVLYDAEHAYCEAGDDRSGDTLYAYPRGNNIGS